MKNTWLVTVVVDNQNIISISDGHISGIGNVSDYEDEIRECAKHLLGFIGELGQLESRPTKHAPDKWESAPSTGIFPPSRLSTSQSESTPPTCG